MAQRFGWEAAARRTILSEEVELASAPGFRVRARKFSIAAQDELRAAQARKRDLIPPAVRALFARAEREGRDLDEIAAELPPAEAEQLLSQIPAEATSTADVMRLSLLHGIGEHTFTDDGSRSNSVSLELVESWLEYPEIATELWGVVRRWNAPLPKATPEKSGTSPNGPTEETASSPASSSPTEATLPG